jgi:hypothetical protein
MGTEYRLSLVQDFKMQEIRDESSGDGECSRSTGPRSLCSLITKRVSAVALASKRRSHKRAGTSYRLLGFSMTYLIISSII